MGREGRGGQVCLRESFLGLLAAPNVIKRYRELRRQSGAAAGVAGLGASGRCVDDEVTAQAEELSDLQRDVSCV